MKKNNAKLVFLILTLILTYLGYKTLLFFNYKVDTEKIGENLHEIGDVINITKNNEINDDKSVKFKNITYNKPEGDLFLDKEKSMESENNMYYTYYINKVEKNNYSAMFKIGSTTYSLHDIFSSDDIFIYGFKLKNLNRPKLLKKYNLNDDYDIIEYIINHNDDKVNFFSSSSKIKMNYFMKTFSATIMPESTIHLINGDYKGYLYVLDDNRYYELHLFNNNENYVFSFINKGNNHYFKVDDVKEFISNINFIQ